MLVLGEAGNSTTDRYGCPDADGDGLSDDNDAFPNDPTRSQDTDGDGYDDLEDNCTFIAGNSTIGRTGCLDTDGDGYADPYTLNETNTWTIENGADAFIEDATNGKILMAMGLEIMQVVSKQITVHRTLLFKRTRNLWMLRY